jgi:hypothetical protein
LLFTMTAKKATSVQRLLDASTHNVQT